MAHRWASATVLKAVFNLCFVALFLQALAFAEWVFASNLSWQSPIAHLIRYFALLLALQAVALVLYFRLPWVGVVLGWISAAVILGRAIPWSTPEWETVLRQFRFELLFLVLAHLGLAAFELWKRAEAAEIAEATGIAGDPSGSSDAPS
ncbi:MAG: hypothetical protein ACRD25_07765 [Terracidiphilus sp.]